MRGDERSSIITDVPGSKNLGCNLANRTAVDGDELGEAE